MDETKKPSMSKRMIIMLVVVGLLLGGLIGFNEFKSYMMHKYMASAPVPPATVSAMNVDFQTWQPQLNAVGTLRAMHGVDVTTEVGFCNFCNRTRNLRREQHHLGAAAAVSSRPRAEASLAMPTWRMSGLRPDVRLDPGSGC